jgi:hypothetical protein
MRLLIGTGAFFFLGSGDESNKKANRTKLEQGLFSVQGANERGGSDGGCYSL